MLSCGGLTTQPSRKYLVDLLPQSDITSPSEYFVSDDRQELPFVGSGVVQTRGIIGTSLSPLIRVSLGSVDWPNPSDANPSVDAKDEALEPKPPSATLLLLDYLDTEQHECFLEIWSRLSPHLRDVCFDLDSPEWRSEGI